MTKRVITKPCLTAPAFLLCLTTLAAGPASAAPHLTTLYHLSNSTNGEADVSGTLAALDGVLYGAAAAGGSAGQGTVFKFDLNSLTETTLSSFTGGEKEGAGPFGPLSRVGPMIYGSTVQGYGTGPGSNGNDTGYGTIWRLNARTGKTKVFHGFSGADGSQPYSGVTPVGGIFYGTTEYGGPTNAGTVFSLTASGKLTQLYAFRGGAAGCHPLDAVTLVGRILYGTTVFCGAGASGTVYAFDLDTGRAKMLHSFASNGSGSAEPNGLVSRNGALYGTTFDDGGFGTVYKIEISTGAYALLHQFSGGADGGTASAGLTLFHGQLYGVTENGGSNSRGTIYRIDPASGVETVVYNFKGGTDGDTPVAGLLAWKDALYGSTLNLASEYPSPRGSLFKFVP